MDTITDILARPGEAARQLSEMRAALEASAACVPAARAALEEIKVQFAAVIAERDAARAEVARLTAALYRVRGEGERLIVLARCKCAGYPHIPPCDAQEWVGDFLRASDEALRGDTAPAGGTSELIHEIEANHKCKCGHWNGDHSESDDGRRRVCMHLGCDCIIDTAPEGRE